MSHNPPTYLSPRKGTETPRVQGRHYGFYLSLELERVTVRTPEPKIYIYCPKFPEFRFAGKFREILLFGVALSLFFSVLRLLHMLCHFFPFDFLRFCFCYPL